MSEAKYQYFCTKCGTTRDSLLDHPAIGIGGYSWNCPRCNGPVDSREIVVSEAPKKIWVGGTEEPHGDWGTIDVYPEDIPYIRADIVDELVKALKECLKVNGYANAREMINAALKKLEDGHEI